MKTRKRLISILMALVMLLSSFTLGFNALASTFPNIGLDIIYSAQVYGSGDMVWYSFTPQLSGTYVFLGYNTGKTSAYLYTRTINDNGSMTYTGLAYAGPSDPDYNDEYYTFDFAGTTFYHRDTNFRLTYHLEAGTTYYYSAGWATSSTTSGTISVRLTCAEYDNTVIESVSVECSANLTWYTDGEWRVDSNQQSYYHYNYSKIIQNMTVTVTYKDGSTSSVNSGADSIDGYSISYNDNQSTNHWYIDSVEEYTANTLTITVAGLVSCDYEVVIGEGPLYTVSGYIIDYTTGEPIANASLRYNNSSLVTTNSNGRFSFAYSPGYYAFTVTAANAIPRTVYIIVDAQYAENNDHTSTPIELIVGDYVKDGIINAKDYGYILTKLSEDKRESEKEKFAHQANFTADKYQQLTLNKD